MSEGGRGGMVSAKSPGRRKGHSFDRESQPAPPSPLLFALTRRREGDSFERVAALVFTLVIAVAALIVGPKSTHLSKIMFGFDFASKILALFSTSPPFSVCGN